MNKDKKENKDKKDSAKIVLSQKGKKMLQEALKDVKKGKVKKFDNIEDLIDDLNDDSLHA